MGYAFLTGGARSGKSAAALRLARRAGGPVAFVATAEAGDDEMRLRIENHRSERPSDWSTFEEPVDPAAAISSVDPSAFVVLDCLTLWLANVMQQDDEQILVAAAELVTVLRAHPGGGVVVSNEVGDGIVPIDPKVRRYRDLLGAVNEVVAEHADDAYLLVAGRTVKLEAPPW